MEEPEKNQNSRHIEKERLIYTMSRIDHYYDSVNNKSAVYLAINTFITGGIIATLSQEGVMEFLNCFELILLLICLILGVGSLILISYASIPFFSTEPKSLYYFGSIGSDPERQFFKASKETTIEEETADLRSQVHILSKGLTIKFGKLKWVGRLLVLQFILIIIIILLITKTYFLL